MKKITWILFLVMLYINVSAFSQGAAINTSGATADPSAMLDVSSSTSGFLLPRMTTSERNAIANPSTGLQIFNLTTMCFEYYAYGIWQTWHCATCPMPYAAGSISGTTVVCPGQSNVSYSVPAITNATSYTWTYTGTGATINGTANAITVDFSASATSGNLTVEGTNICGNGTISPNYSITINNAPSAPAAGTSTPSQYQIAWNWNTVSGATGYKYNTVNNYASATDNGASTSYTQTGLNCNTNYTLYVWAYNACGNSTASTLTKSTTSCPLVCGTSTITFTYNGSSVTYGTVTNSTTGECWLDRNLGATQVATAYNDANSYGDLFQWGRLDDGHQVRSSTTTTTLSTTDVPGHSQFIANDSPANWRNPDNDNLWQGVSGTNNPCPSGWRVATEAELNAERLSWAPNNNRAGAMLSPLKLPTGGYRGNMGGFGSEGDTGYYWSSTISGGPKDLNFDNSSAGIGGGNRVAGRSVRCILD